MLTEPSFVKLLQSLDKRANGNKSYGFRQDLWAEIVDELEFLNDVLLYINTTEPGLVDEAAEAVQKAREK
jgi:hypothetical protein